jgi:hypothetical protein
MQTESSNSVPMSGSHRRHVGCGGWRRLPEYNYPSQSPWTKVVDESKKPFFRWFVDGKTNVAYKTCCLKSGESDRVG